VHTYAPEPPSDNRPPAAASPPPNDHGGWRPSGLCSQFVCDIASFGAATRGDAARAHLRQALYAALRTAFDAEGCPFDSCYREDRGDGVMLIVPPHVDTALLITSIAFRLRAEVRRHNEFSSEATRMPLRVAVNTGPVEWDGRGVVGKALNDAFRILDAEPFKRVLSASGADLALIVTRRVYDDVVSQGRGLLNRHDYRPLDIAVKELRETAWATLPGLGPPPGLPAEPGTGTLVRTPEDLAPRTVRPEEISGPAGLGRFGDLRYAGGDVPPPVLFELVDRALEIAQLMSEPERERAVGALPRDIAGVIPRSRTARADVYEIIRTCLGYPGGLQALLVALHGLGGESLAFLEFKRAIVRLLFEPE